MTLSKEMQRALKADGEKLKALTGEDHGPRFPAPHEFLLCDADGEPCYWPACRAHGCMCNHGEAVSK